jgi:NADH:ubiquinone oxidoreductase subunit
MSIGTRLYTYFRGQLVGADATGNRYYQERAKKAGHLRRRRWVMFQDGIEEASVVPPEWHAWLHYTTDAPLSDAGRHAWQKPHLPNLTGTALGYRPPGHDYKGGQRPETSGDYESWTPGS